MDEAQVNRLRRNFHAHLARLVEFLQGGDTPLKSANLLPLIHFRCPPFCAYKPHVVWAIFTFFL
nr:MAG TPA: hypothetical protein [Caudoviricetes sp.]